MNPTPEPDTFDPHSVPVFPRLAMEVSTSQRTITLDGSPVPASAGVDLIDTAVEAAAERIAQRHLGHARIAAIVDDERYTLVVGADGSRHNLDTDTATTGKGRTGARRPVWPLLVGAAVLVLVCSTIAGVAIAAHQRATRAEQPAEPVAPPAGELPIVPTEAWTTHATWTLPLEEPASRAEVVLTPSSVVAVTAGNELTAVDPQTGITQWASSIGGGVVQGPVLTEIDGQESIAIATSDELLWWPAAGSPAPSGTVEFESAEEVLFTGTSPLIVGRGQLARTIVGGQAVERTIPAGAEPVRADDGTVLAVNALGQLWQLDQADTYVPDPIQLTGPEKAEGSVSVVGTSGDLLGLQWSTTGQGSQQLLYRLDGEQVGKPITASSREWDSGPEEWSLSGPTLINTRTADHRLINDGDWQTVSVGADIYGRAGQATVRLDPDTGHVEPEPNPDAEAPLTSDASHGYYAAEDNDGEPRLYAVIRNGDN